MLPPVLPLPSECLAAKSAAACLLSSLGAASPKVIGELCSSEIEYACRNRDSGEWPATRPPPREEEAEVEEEEGGDGRGGVDADALLIASPRLPLAAAAAASAPLSCLAFETCTTLPWWVGREEETAIGLEEVGRGEHGRCSGLSSAALVVGDGSDDDNDDASVRPGSCCIFVWNPPVGGSSSERACSSAKEGTVETAQREHTRAAREMCALCLSLFFLLRLLDRGEKKKIERENQKRKKNCRFSFFYFRWLQRNGAPLRLPPAAPCPAPTFSQGTTMWRSMCRT